jgi:adenylate cyclase
MASFVTPSRAVACSIAIQQGFHTHNEATETASHIRVRIGVTAGEPVAEDQDLFGAAVQLAARICNCAEPNEILVANVMRELCIGKDFLFSDRGAQPLRGFEEPVQLWEVRWQDGD